MQPPLHVIREHPIFLSNYEIIFKKNSALFYLSLINKLLWNSILGTYKLFHSFYRNYFTGDRVKREMNIDYLFVSHFLNQNFLNHKSDFYFFDLPDYLYN